MALLLAKAREGGGSEGGGGQNRLRTQSAGVGAINLHNMRLILHSPSSAVFACFAAARRRVQERWGL